MGYTIYTAQHVKSGRWFIGFTVKPTGQEGFNHHKYTTEKGGVLNQLVREEGLDAFVVADVDTATTLKEAHQKRDTLITQHDCYEPKGLNRKWFGYLNPEQLEKCRKAHQAYIESDRFKEYLATRDQTGPRNSRFGVKLSDEIKAKMSESQKKRYRENPGAWKGRRGMYKKVSNPWKYPLGSKPWHRLPADMNYDIGYGRIPRSKTVTHYVRREVDAGVKDYASLLQGIIQGLRDGTIQKKPASWRIIHYIIKETLMNKVYKPQGYKRWSKTEFSCPAFEKLPSFAPDLNIPLGVEPEPIDPDVPRRRRGRPRTRPLTPTVKPPKRKRDLSPENKVKMIDGLKRYHRNKRLRKLGLPEEPVSVVAVVEPVSEPVTVVPVKVGWWKAFIQRLRKG
jgi:hypothetical protein